MRHILLVHGDEHASDVLSDAERADRYERYGKLQRETEEHGGGSIEVRPIVDGLA